MASKRTLKRRAQRARAKARPLGPSMGVKTSLVDEALKAAYAPHLLELVEQADRVWARNIWR
jgi:hypothetical protein